MASCSSSNGGVKARPLLLAEWMTSVSPLGHLNDNETSSTFQLPCDVDQGGFMFSVLCEENSSGVVSWDNFYPAVPTKSVNSSPLQGNSPSVGGWSTDIRLAFSNAIAHNRRLVVL